LRIAAARDISAGAAKKGGLEIKHPKTCARQCLVAMHHAVERDMRMNQGGAANARQIIA